jgi:hypothetical protein
MLTVVTFKYAPRNYRTTYTAAHVNTLRNMVARHYSKPHRFICITDDPTGVECDSYQLWDDFREMANPSHATARPNCYPRLKLFSKNIGEYLEIPEGGKILSLDLDTAIVDDVSPIFERPEDFVIFDAKGDGRYQGSIQLIKVGSRPMLWDEFDPVKTPQITSKAGFKGSDQAWIRYRLPSEAVWTKRDGVLSYLQMIPSRREQHVRPSSRWLPPRNGALPPGTRIVSFAGQNKPWDPRVQQQSQWLKEHYR